MAATWTFRPVRGLDAAKSRSSAFRADARVPFCLVRKEPKTAAPDASRRDEAASVPCAPRRSRAAPNSGHPWPSNNRCLLPRPPPVLGSLYGAQDPEPEPERQAKQSRLAHARALDPACRSPLLIWERLGASRAPQERGGARPACPSTWMCEFGPAPSFRGAQGTGTVSSSRLA